MSEIMKHVGMINNTGKRCIVAFLQIPNKETHALVVDSEALPERIHDPLISLLRSSEAQQAKHLGEVLGRRMMPDSGRTMLEELHAFKYLQAQPVENITLFPRPNVKINLKDMLEAMGQLERKADEEAGIIAPEIIEQQNKEIIDPAVVLQETAAANIANLTADEKSVQATNLLVQAELLENDANMMKEKAYALVPSMRPVSKAPSVRAKKESKVEPKATTTSRKNSSGKTATV